MAEADKHSSRSSRHTSSGSSRKRSEKGGEEEAKPDDGLSRSERRKKEERDAKRKSRSSSSSQASTPGAVASAGEHKSSRSKKTSDSKIEDDKQKLRLAPGADGEEKSSSRPSKRDPTDKEKAGYRRSGSATTRGAQAEVSSPRSSKRDPKDKERRASRASRPGAEVSSSSRDRPSRNKSGGGGVPASPLGASARSTVSANVGEDNLAAATIVEEEKEDEDAKRKREEARIQAMVDAKTNKAIQQMQEERERHEAEEKEKKRKAKERRNKIICVLIILALIGGGVGAYVALTNKKAATPQQQQERSPPSADPSSSPSNVELKYPEPNLDECELIAKGLKIPGEDEMFVTSFAIPMEVTLEPGNDIDSLMSDLEIAIEKYSVPNLIGCPRELFQSRRLGHPDLTDTKNVSLWSEYQRQLQSVVSNRWAIAKAIVDGTVNSGACEYSSSPDCTVVTFTMVLRVRGEEKIVSLANIIGLIFPFMKDIQPDLQLGSPFASVVVAPIKSLDETEPLTFAPIGVASETPSASPSSSPSTSPTSAPAIGPTTPAPTSLPSKSPTQNPTFSPSNAPTPTPRPTLAPQPGPSPPPTALPTKSPSIFPTKSPSSKPSLSPSVSPSNRVTPAPTSAPTDRPTFAPSGGPTLQPSTPQPTIAPSLPPSAMPVNPGLESYLYCGCTMDGGPGMPRDLTHQNPNTGLSQVACIHYCKSLGYDFAGLQYVNECFCGNSAGAYGNSITCFTQDRNRDGVHDVCGMRGPGECYDGSDSCSCGGAMSNTLFRTSQAVSCPPENPPYRAFLGCYRDTINRDLSVFGMEPGSVAGCRNLCKDMGFVFSAIQYGESCFCGNDYGNYGLAICNNACSVDPTESGCGGTLANSIYWSGAALEVNPDLEDNLYCGCMGDLPSQRDLEHLAPYSGKITQKACIYYCRGKGYDFAGIQSGSQCWCGNSPGTHSSSTNCNIPCHASEASVCYDGSPPCTCASFNVPVYETLGGPYYTAPARLAIDGNTCGGWGCGSVASTSQLLTINPAITIDLGFLATVGKVVVWNRSDCCWDRLNGFILELLDANQNVKSGSARTLTDALEQPFVFTGMTNVRYVRIRKVGEGTVNIAEVQVFS